MFVGGDPSLYDAASHYAAANVEVAFARRRGERGALRIGAADLLRLHWNPFHSYMERRVLEFVR